MKTDLQIPVFRTITTLSPQSFLACWQCMSH